jgi:hypothetical protein
MTSDPLQLNGIQEKRNFFLSSLTITPPIPNLVLLDERMMQDENISAFSPWLHASI